MQYNSEISEQVILDCSSAPPPNPLTKNDDHRIQRIRKHLLILNGIISVSYFFIEFEYHRNKSMPFLKQRPRIYCTIHVILYYVTSSR